MEIEHKIFEAEVKEFNEQNLTLTHFISTERRDRGNDILYADGMRMDGRPVVLFMHGFGSAGLEPIAKPNWIRKGEFKGRKGIQCQTQFFPDDTGKRLWQKAKDGYLPNWSIGWRPLKHEFKTEDGVEIRHVKEWELLEYSLVGVPMQPDAQTVYDDGKGLKQGEIRFKVMPSKEIDELGELTAWKKEDDTWEEKPYPNEHACRIEDPGKYVRIRRQNDKFGKGVHAIWGIMGGGKAVELQALRFSKDKFTAKEARAWVKDHDYKCKLFEPASEKCLTCGKDMVIKWAEDVEGEKCVGTCTAEFYFSCEECAKEEKGVIKYRKTPLAKEDEAWDGPGEKSKATPEDLRAMCAWYDDKNPDVKSSYALPHHKAGGDHACVWNGVKAAAAALMGARGGVKKIPKGDIDGVRAHLTGHYKDFEKGDPPWKKEMGIGLLEAQETGMTTASALRLIASWMMPELAEFFEPESKSALPYKKTKLDKYDAPWKGQEEYQRATCDDLKEMAVWYNDRAPGKKSSYKGIHHRADKEHSCVWKAVRALVAHLVNARGGIHIPTTDLKKARDHVEAHWHEFGKGPVPWKNKEGQEFIALLESSETWREGYGFIEGKAKQLIPDLSEFFAVDVLKAKAIRSDQEETVKFVSVNPDEVKDKYNVDFTEGGNHYAEDYIPEDECWFDGAMSEESVIETKGHEFIERLIMKYLDWDYNDAHDVANKVSRLLRHIVLLETGADLGGDDLEDDGGDNQDLLNQDSANSPEVKAFLAFVKNVEDGMKEIKKAIDDLKQIKSGEGWLRGKHLVNTDADDAANKGKGLAPATDPVSNPELLVDLGKSRPQDNPPGIVKVVNSQEDEKRQMAEIAKQVSIQLSGMTERINASTREMVRAEFDRARGKVK